MKCQTLEIESLGESNTELWGNEDFWRKKWGEPTKLGGIETAGQ